jgi:hypothetical protein
MHVYVDESNRRSYLLCALLVHEDSRRLRGTVRALCRPGQRRIHFSKEGDPRRRAILSTLTELGVLTRIYRSRSAEPDRDTCLAALLDDLVPLGPTQLVLERRGPQDRQDEALITAALRASGSVLTFRHTEPHDEPLLWVPDAVAWAVGRGGDWRRRAEPLVEKLVDAGP